ncbi:hypothetical protein [Saccharicrinis sp. 156]|uniref:hypothetical protein n=1 Tax=Saccharicrinis sp. 156 TaxID=3417574 RepID=UPI003D3425A4
MEKKEKIIAQSKIDLAKAYNVSYKTFNSWLEPLHEKLGEYRGKTYTPKQVSIIYEKLGRPN